MGQPSPLSTPPNNSTPCWNNGSPPKTKQMFDFGETRPTRRRNACSVSLGQPKRHEDETDVPPVRISRRTGTRKDGRRREGDRGGRRPTDRPNGRPPRPCRPPASVASPALSVYVSMGCPAFMPVSVYGMARDIRMARYRGMGIDTGRGRQATF